MWRKSHHTSWNRPHPQRAAGTASPVGSTGGQRVGPCSGMALSVFHFLSGNNWQCQDDFPDTLEGWLLDYRVTYVPFEGKKPMVFPSS